MQGRLNELTSSEKCLEQCLTHSECPIGGVIVIHCWVPVPSVLLLVSVNTATKPWLVMFVRWRHEAFPWGTWFWAYMQPTFVHLLVVLDCQVVPCSSNTVVHMFRKTRLRITWQGFFLRWPSRVSRPCFYIYFTYTHVCTHTYMCI